MRSQAVAGDTIEKQSRTKPPRLLSGRASTTRFVYGPRFAAFGSAASRAVLQALQLASLSCTGNSLRARIPGRLRHSIVRGSTARRIFGKRAKTRSNATAASARAS